MKRLVAILFSLLVSASAAGAQDIDKGKDAYENEDYKTALVQLLPLAERGNAEAQYFVGLMYDLGQAVTEDKIEGAKWLKAAAEQGFGSAQLWLGVVYNRGRGEEPNYVLAYMWANLATSATKWPEEETDVYKTAHLKLARYLRDKVLALEMTPAEIREAQRRTREWLDAHPQ